MGAPFHYLCGRVEKTLQAYIKTMDDPGIDVWTFGQAAAYGQELSEPYISVRSRSFEPAFPEVQLGEGYGNQYLQCDVFIRTHAEDYVDDNMKVVQAAIDAHDLLCGRVMDQLFRTDNVLQLNNAAAQIGNINFNIVDAPSGVTDIRDRSWETTVTFRVLCNPTA